MRISRSQINGHVGEWRYQPAPTDGGSIEQIGDTLLTSYGKPLGFVTSVTHEPDGTVRLGIALIGNRKTVGTTPIFSVERQIRAAKEERAKAEAAAAGAGR
jgi:hypothetical protein